ncbi:glycosyltransferase family 2 protein [Rhodopirellula europaea]|uniref:glycosyltransferase family 2 protein n=1 Tax=Rhodopirellula europaea TaxID=1263866 RepID=UPI003D2E89B4
MGDISSQSKERTSLAVSGNQQTAKPQANERDRHDILGESVASSRAGDRKLRLFIQIPCLNESNTLSQTIKSIPRSIEGVSVAVVVIDDGSTDGTHQVAKQAGADFVVRHKKNLGLASAFRTGIDTCLKLGADLIVNLDGDNQYNAADVPLLIAPILNQTADIVVGDRRPSSNPEFGWAKRCLQRIGSWAISRIHMQAAPDAVSGFRAFSKEAAIKLSVLSSFSYTLETLLQAKVKQLTVAWVVIRTNPSTRPSRLARSIPEFLCRSGFVIIRTYYRQYPLRVFSFGGVALVGGGVIPLIRFLWLYMQGKGDGMVQSLVIGAMLITTGVFTFLIGIVADLIASNRQLVETVLEKVKRMELD